MFRVHCHGLLGAADIDNISGAAANAHKPPASVPIAGVGANGLPGHARVLRGGETVGVPHQRCVPVLIEYINTSEAAAETPLSASIRLEELVGERVTPAPPHLEPIVPN